MNSQLVFKQPLINSWPVKRRSKRYIRGSALPICLLLSGILSLLAVGALRSATAEARLSVSVLAAHQAFSLARQGSTSALIYARQQPEKLPAPQSLPIIIPVIQPADPNHGIEAEITATGTDASCPYLLKGKLYNGEPLSGELPNIERRHYEIRSTGWAGTSAIRIHVQGFYICREICSGNDCIGTETGPVPSYWTLAET